MIDTRDENVEIELKILVQDEEAFTRYLEEHTTFIKEEMIEDTYFDNPDYPFLYIDEKGLKNTKKRLKYTSHFLFWTRWETLFRFFIN